MTSRSITGALAALALATAVPCTLAQDVKGKPAQKPVVADKGAMAGMAAPKPAPEMAQLKFFDGSWSCAGDFPAGPMGPAQKTKSTVKSHTAMGGFWQVGDVSMTSPGMSMQGTFHTTYDAGQKRYVMLWVDNMGGYAQQTSPGFEGDKLVYTGEGNMMGQKMQARDTFTKGADGSLKHSAEGQMNGQWVSMGEEICHKSAPAAAKK